MTSKSKSLNVVVTGGSSGLGVSIARRYAKQHAAILLTARRLPELEAVAKECLALGAQAVHVLSADVGEESGCKAIADKAAAVFGSKVS